LLNITDSLSPCEWNGDGSNFLAATVGDGNDPLLGLKMETKLTGMGGDGVICSLAYIHAHGSKPAANSHTQPWFAI